jgi:hypothetical protein
MLRFWLADSKGTKSDQGTTMLVWPTKEWQKGEWKHICGTWGRDGARLYIDGKLVAEQTKNLHYPDRVRDTFRLCGESHKTSDIITTMDDLRIYKRPLSADEVKDLFEMGKLK